MFRNWLIYNIARDSPVSTADVSASKLARVDKVIRQVSWISVSLLSVQAEQFLDFTQINRIIIYYRNTTLVKLCPFAADEKRIWQKYSKASYHQSIEALEKHLSKKGTALEDEPEWTVTMVHLGELMHKWRLRAQKYEQELEDKTFVSHHLTRNKRSINGPLMRPDGSHRPEVTTKDETRRGELSVLLDLLSHTGCNWAGFPNRGGSIFKWVKLTMMSLDLREDTYVDKIFKSKDTQWIFYSVGLVLQRTKRTIMTTIACVPAVDDDGLEEPPSIPPVLNTGFIHPDMDHIDHNLSKGLHELVKLGATYGSLDELGNKSTNVVKAIRALAMALAETALWKKGTYDGLHQARHGNIEDSILEAKVNELIELPSVENSFSSQKASKILPVKSVGDVFAAAAANQPSNAVQMAWSLEEKKRFNQKKKEAKAQKMQYFLQQDTIKAPASASGTTIKTKISAAKKKALDAYDTRMSDQRMFFSCFL